MGLFNMGGGGVAAMLGIDTEQMEQVYQDTMETLRRYDAQLKAIAESQARIELMLEKLDGDLNADKQPEPNQE